MKATTINNHESEFFKQKKDSDGKLFDLKLITKSIKGTKEKLEYYDCTINKKTDKNKIHDFCVKDEKSPPKKQIVLHFTAGFLRGDLAELTRGIIVKTKKRNRVSVPFIIARNGRILKIWDEKKYWAYHLGPNIPKKYNQKTIGIELSNIGYLERQGDDLHTIYSKKDKEQVYCSYKDDQKYFTEIPFRNKKYFATFTNAQYNSLIKLLKYLTREHGIAPTFLDIKDRYLYKRDREKLLKAGGIVSHVNYRPSNSGKWDLGPAFDWNRVIEGVQKEGEKPPAQPIPTSNAGRSPKSTRTIPKPPKKDRTVPKPPKKNRKIPKPPKRGK